MSVMTRTLDQVHELHFEHIHHRRIGALATAFASRLAPGASVLDVGSGDGYLAASIMRLRPDVEITGVDVLARREAFIPVTMFDGVTLPFEADSFDVVMFSDVLHHTTTQAALIGEAVRVARRHVLVKDHLNERRVDEWRLRAMDWIGNRHNGVPLPYEYWSQRQWCDAFWRAGLRIDVFDTEIVVHPRPLDAVIGSGLHVMIRGRVRS